MSTDVELHLLVLAIAICQVWAFAFLLKLNNAVSRLVDQIDDVEEVEL